MRLRILFLLTFVASSLSAGISPAPLYRDGAILQHGKAVPVWGSASPGEEITVTFGAQSETATADQNGHWTLTLAPLPPNAEPAEMVISGNESITVSDILVGEVWLASGQSNMQWPVNNSYDADLEALMARWPLIREFTAARVVADKPQTTLEGEWRDAQPDSINQFSAVAYYFARDLHQALQMPIGIINSSWGGTPVEPWTDPITLSRPDFAAVQERQQKIVANFTHAQARHSQAVEQWMVDRDAAAQLAQPFNRPAPQAPSTPRENHAPSALYNGMIHPLIPYALRGAIWYQGESNVGRHHEYHALFSAMIEGWRELFQQEDFPFYWVQLAGFRAESPANTEWAFLREAQTQTLALPATGQAIILDISDIHDIHPRNKQTVGRRLARLALNRTYGQGVVDSGPAFTQAEFNGETARIHFDHAYGGLRTVAITLRGFELAGEDRAFHAADAKISGSTVILTSAQVPNPVAARYAWRNASEATLSNETGLPAVPFRTDAW